MLEGISGYAAYAAQAAVSAVSAGALDFVDLSGWGVVGLMVLGLLTGKVLATRREVDAEKVRADTWQQAWATAMEANRVKDVQQAELLENSRTTVRILEAISHEAAAGRGGAS